MAEAARTVRRRFMCMALNASGRPAPMFDPFLGDAPVDEDEPVAAGAIELLLFGDRQTHAPVTEKA